MECYHYLLAIEDNEWSLSLLNFLKLLFQIHSFGLVLCMTKSLFCDVITCDVTRMCTVFLQSITVSGYIPLKEKLLGVLIF